MRLVARREVLERTRERSFAVGTLVTIVIVAAVIVLPSLFGGGPDKIVVAVASPGAERVARAAARADDPFDVRVRVRRVASDAQVRRLLADDRADAGVVADGRSILRHGGTPDGGVAALQAASQRLRQAAPPPPALPVATVDAGAEDRQGFAAIALIVLYGQLISYGIWVATGIVEEKTSRIVEILLATVRPRELLAGKVLGIGLVGFAQLLLIGAVGLLIAAVSGRVDIGGDELGALPIVLATVAALIAVAGRVYGNAVLQTGGRVRLRAALARD